MAGRRVLLRVAAVCVLLSLGTQPNASAAGPAQTSTYLSSLREVETLFAAETAIAARLRDVLAAKEQELVGLRHLIERIESGRDNVPAPGEAYHPQHVYSLLRRVVSASLHLQDDTEAGPVEPVEVGLAEWPNSEDLMGAATALLRLQRVYTVTASFLLPNASASDYALVGKHAYGQEDFRLAVEWLGLARQSASGDELADVLDHLSYASHVLHQPREAIDAARDLLELEPDNVRIRDNIQFYTKDLKAGDQHRGDRRGGDDHHVAADNLLRNSQDVVHRYRRLCRMERVAPGPEEPSPSPWPRTPANQFCELSNFGQSRLLLRPARVEHLVFGSIGLKVFRDFASHAECDHLKAEAAAHLERSVAYEDDKFVPVKFRTSSVCWLDPDHDAVVADLHTRIADATQLNIEHAEELQVSNYGIGGHYECHHDYLANASNIELRGNRLATFMIYLEEVQAGGCTAFPRLGAFVQPRKGDAAFWFNLSPGTGEGNLRTLHCACPVLIGSKWVANKWIRQKGNEAPGEL